MYAVKLESLKVILQPLAWLLNRTDRSLDGSSELTVSVEKVVAESSNDLSNHFEASLKIGDGLQY